MAQGDVGVEKARGVRGSLIVMMINVTVCTSHLTMIFVVYLVVFRVSVYFRMGNQSYGVSCLTLDGAKPLFNILT